MSVSEFKKGLKAHLEADGAVNALVGTRIFPITFPEGGDLPAIAYRVIDSGFLKSLLGPALREITLELTAADESAGPPDDVADAIEAALEGFAGDIGASGVIVQEVAIADTQARVDQYQEDARLYAVALRFVFRI